MSGTPYRAYVFCGVRVQHKDFPSEEEADAAVEQVKRDRPGWDGWTEPVSADELPDRKQERDR